MLKMRKSNRQNTSFGTLVTDSSPFLRISFCRTFDQPVCDECKNMERDGPHELITKTDAKKQFLLSDLHFEREGNPLKFLLRKNPHNPKYGDMKLFLRMQIEKVALDVWGSEEELIKVLTGLFLVYM